MSCIEQESWFEARQADLQGHRATALQRSLPKLNSPPFTDSRLTPVASVPPSLYRSPRAGL